MPHAPSMPIASFWTAFKYSRTMSSRYRTSAIALEDGSAAVPDGMAVRVTNPLRDADDAASTNPEQLLALAWASCLRATASVLTDARTRVRVEVELRDAEGRVGFEFHVTAFVSAEGLSPEGAERLAAAAHARCPVSRLLHGAQTVRVRSEPFNS